MRRDTAGILQRTECENDVVDIPKRMGISWRNIRKGAAQNLSQYIIVMRNDHNDMLWLFLLQNMLSSCITYCDHKPIELWYL